jgi:hypothetical protein
MELPPDVGGGKGRTRLHGGPVAGERRAFRDLRAETGEFHAAEKHGPDDVGDAVGGRYQDRAAITQRLLEPVHEADGLRAAAFRELDDGVRLEGGDPPGKYRGARSIDRSQIGVCRGVCQELAARRLQSLRDHDPRQRVAGEQASEGQFLDRIGIVEIDPGLRFGIGGGAKRILGDVATLDEDAISQHQRGHRHARIEPHVIRLLLAQPVMDIDEDAFVVDAALGEREARDHRIVGGRRLIEPRSRAGEPGSLGHEGSSESGGTANVQEACCAHNRKALSFRARRR